MLNKMARAFLLPLLLAPLSAYALGLGELTVRSSLGQPFRASIELVGVRPGDEETLRVGLASVDDHLQAGLERSYVYSLLKFELTAKPDGGVVAEVTSSRPINEPFLNFLVEAYWAQGRLLKEYTVFLDPPVIPVSRPVVSQVPQSIASTGGSSVPSGAPTDLPDSYGPVRSGETLWGIAQVRQQQTGLSLDQIMLAIVRANPHAFVGDNANRLLAGVVLRIPDAAAMGGIDASVAASEIAAQTEQWKQSRLAGTRTSSVAGQVEGQVERRDVDPKKPAVPEVSDDVDRRSQDMLRLVQGDEDATSAGRDGSAGQGDLGAKEREILLLEEKLDAKQLENDELRNRIQKLEAQLATLQKMVELLPDDGEAAIEGLEPPVPVSGLESAQTQPEEGSEDTAVNEAASMDVEQDSESREQSSGAAAPVTTPLPQSKPVSTPPPPPAKPAPGMSRGVLSWVMGNLLIVGGVIVLIVLAVVVVLRRNRAGEEEDSFADQLVAGEETVVAEADQEETAVAEFTDTAVSAGVEGDAEPEDDFFSDMVSPASTARSVDTVVEDVDPIAEADVYLTYGRHQQAEEILADAVQYDPDRLELKLKLLEVIYAQEKGDEFARFVAENQDVLRSDANWSQIAAMGFRLAPDNELFAGGGEYEGEIGRLVASQGVEQDMLDLEDSGAEPEESEFVDSLDFDELDEVSDQDELTANLDLDEFSGEFDSTSVDLSGPKSGREEDSNELEFDETATIMTESPVDDDSGISLDIGSDDSVVEDTGIGLGSEEETPDPVEPIAGDTLVEEDVSLDFSPPAFEEDREQPEDIVDEVVETEATTDDNLLEFDVSPVATGEDDGEADIESVAPEPALDDDNLLEFDISDTDPASVGKVEEDEEGGLTLDFSSAEEDEEVSLEFDASGLETDAEDSGLEFELDGADEEDGLDATLISNSGIDLGTDQDSETMQTLDAISSKLDLLAAYVEMGDREAAETVCGEILEFGNEDQKKQAQDLLAQLD